MFNLEKINQAAAKLGFDLKFNSSNPGIHFWGNDGDVKTVNYNDIDEVLNQKFNSSSSQNRFNYSNFNSKKIQISIKETESYNKSILKSREVDRIQVEMCGKVTQSEKGEDVLILLSHEYHDYDKKKINKAA